MPRINVGDPALVRRIADDLSALGLGPKDVPPGEHWLPVGLANVDMWRTALDRGSLPDDTQAFFRFVMGGLALTEAAQLENGESFIHVARAYARAGAFDQFDNQVFEAEVAAFMKTSMGATQVGFGPPHGHPDICGTFEINGRPIEFAIECKRLAETGRELAELQDFAERIEGLLLEAFAQSPSKVIVWLHRRSSSIAVEEVAQTVRKLQEECTGTRWVTDAAADGSYQVSVADLGEAATFSREEHRVEDVPAEPVLITRAEIHREPEGDIARVKHVLSVRTDRMPSHLGQLRQRADHAIGQLQESVNSDSCGIIAVRVRRPRDKGDIAEADMCVRTLLGQPTAAHVSLAVLFWNRSDRREGVNEWIDEVNWRRESRMEFTLVPHFIAGAPEPINFSRADSRVALMPDHPVALVRNPATGTLTPIPLQDFHRFVDGQDVTDPRLLFDARGQGEPAATIYLKLDPAYWQLPGDVAAGVIITEDAQFRAFLTRDGRLQAVEFNAGTLVSIATIDLHAWFGEPELCFVINWRSKGFLIGLERPTSKGLRLWVESTAVPGYSTA